MSLYLFFLNINLILNINELSKFVNIIFILYEITDDQTLNPFVQNFC